jgi:hypothetical protein
VDFVAKLALDPEQTATFAVFVRKGTEGARAMSDLTPRQRQIDRLVRRGLTSRQIAGKLSISQRTVEAHRGNIARRAAGGQDKDPLEHPAVQRLLRRLSVQITALASEIKDLRVPR